MASQKLLIIEDEKSVAKQLRWSLGKIYDITIAPDADAARSLLRSGAFPVTILDLGLPPTPDTPAEGLKLLDEIHSLAPHTKAIVVTGNAEKKNALEAVSLGATDFCSKPIEVNVLKIILERTFRICELESANRYLQSKADHSYNLCGMLGVAPATQKMFAMIRKVSTNNYPALITGESGTGKELAAHAIHSLSPRKNRPFVIINCGAIPENLLESELFGHEKGAFTGAAGRKIGKFEQAHTGSVFLDEIGELPLALQVKLLRCLQEGTIERIGSNQTISLDVRVLAATNADLEKAVENGTFREDLYFRLNVLPIRLPPLTERPEDILVLSQAFLRQETKTLKTGRVSFAHNALAALTTHRWLGNIRELQNRIRRALSMSNGQIITAADLGLEVAVSKQTCEKLLTLKEARNQAERRCIRQALLLTGNNISQAAKLLSTSRPTLHDLITKHKIATT